MKSICPTRRTLLVGLLTTLCLCLATTTVHQVVLPLLGWLFPAFVSSFFDLAVYGPYPATEFVTFNLTAPSSNVVAWDDRCDGGYILVAPFGESVPDEGPMILDARGNLVWMTTAYNVVMNMKIQTYQGDPYLTFWAGNKIGGIGQGDYIMLNSSYDRVHTVSAVSPPNHPEDLRMGDLHEFIISDDDTALLTVYNTTGYDLSAMGRPNDGWIVDSLFQEIDIATGKLLFEWRASEHFDPATTSQYINPFGGYKQASPYDFFHLNSVQKTRDGDYVISSRHLHAVICVSGQTGDVLWVLGGEFNTFEDLTGGKATSFKWQHDARIVDEGAGILTLFDNECAGPIMTDASESQGLLIKLDLDKMTAKLLRSYSAKSGIRSASQGSVQIFEVPQSISDAPLDDPEAHVLVGWGSSAAYSEYTLGGELLCETHLSASILFWFERVKSYRAIKNFDWIGRPSTSPSVAQSSDRIYVSWNGATEVSAWQLEERKRGPNDDAEWRPVDIKEKQAFEDSFAISEGTALEYRVAALDRDGALLRYSNVVDHSISKSRSSLWWIFGICAAIGVLVGVCSFLRRGPQRTLSAISETLRDRWRRKWYMAGVGGYRYRKVPGIEMS